MTLNEISNIRLNSQKIAGNGLKTAKEIVRWMGAMQAQDYAMAKWALGVRVSDSTDESIEASVAKGEIIRTHLMRPTWHFVPSEDIFWMLELTAPRIKSFMKSNDSRLGLSEAVFTKSNSVIENALADGGSLSRAELEKEFNKAGINTDENRLSHLLVRAELDAIVCSWPINPKKHVYSLLDVRVPQKKVLSREESLAELAGRYFRSHCPATLQDFNWWSGLSLKDCRQAMESVIHDFTAEIIDSEKYLFPDSFSCAADKETSVHILPAYDEFLISYKDRSASLLLADNKRTVSVNGIFYPVIVVDGVVRGLWRRETKQNKVIIEPKMFKQLNKKTKTAFEEKAHEYGRFLNKDVEFRYPV